MRKKLLSKTYLRDVRRYDIKFSIGNKEYSYAVKKFLDTAPFILPDGMVLIDNNYYMLEFIPFKENYSMRVYFNDKKELLLYYFDISRENGIDEETKIPYYDDLFLDVVYRDGTIEILDEDELKEALDTKVISKEEYELANRAAKELIEEIKNNSNPYINRNLLELL